MKVTSITINGTAYPCTPSGGAMLRFKRETGKEISELRGDSISEMITYLWCCVAAACKREGKPFDYSLMDFADMLTMDEMAAWQQSIIDHALAQPETDDEKKSL